MNLARLENESTRKDTDPGQIAAEIRLATELRQRGRRLIESGDLGLAGQALQRAFSIIEGGPGSEHAETAALYHELASLEHAGRNPARGLPYARRALKLHRKMHGSGHVDVARDQLLLGALLADLRRESEAEPLVRCALKILRRRLGPEHLEVATALNNLAALRHAQRDSREAEKLYRRALAIKKKSLGARHPGLATTWNNLAVLAKRSGRFREAESLYRKCLTVLERAFGASHPRRLAALENYAALLRRMGRNDAAERLERRADGIRAGLETISSSDAIATATLNPLFACFRLSVQPSQIHRWGVFAEEPIPAGRKIIEYTGERVSRREAKLRSESHEFDYLFAVDSYWFIDGATGGSGAEYINHSCDPNLRARIVRGHVLYMSIRAIEPREELTIDYRFDKKAERTACHCGSSACRGTINLT